MANPENETPADDTNAEERTEVTEAIEEVKELEPEQDVKGGGPFAFR
jgi:hypothetical protein